MLENGGQGPARLAMRYSTEVSASGASVLSTLAAFPLDSVKTRMQTYQYNGVLDCIRHTYRTESLKGFFRGMFMPATQLAFSIIGYVWVPRLICIIVYRRRCPDG